MWLLGTHLSRQPKWISHVPSPANNSALFSPTSLPHSSFFSSMDGARQAPYHGAPALESHLSTNLGN